MSAKIIAFFNYKGGVGKTTFAYHSAWVFAQLGYRTLLVDLDPQANLSALALPGERFKHLSLAGHSFSHAIQPLFKGYGDIRPAHIEALSDRLAIIPGSLDLFLFEEDLYHQWPRCLEGKERAIRVTTAIWRVIQDAAVRHNTDVAIVDMSPSLGALNRAAVIGLDYLVLLATPDLFAIQGVQHVGMTIWDWIETWRTSATLGDHPKGNLTPIGYALRTPTQTRADLERWEALLSATYARYILRDENADGSAHLLWRVKDYHHLLPTASAQHIPMFALSDEDAQACYEDFYALVRAIIHRACLVSPSISRLARQ